LHAVRQPPLAADRTVDVAHVEITVERVRREVRHQRGLRIDGTFSRTSWSWAESASAVARSCEPRVGVTDGRHREPGDQAEPGSARRRARRGKNPRSSLEHGMDGFAPTGWKGHAAGLHCGHSPSFGCICRGWRPIAAPTRGRSAGTGPPHTANRLFPGTCAGLRKTVALNAPGTVTPPAVVDLLPAQRDVGEVGRRRASRARLP